MAASFRFMIGNILWQEKCVNLERYNSSKNERSQADFRDIFIENSPYIQIKKHLEKQG